LSGRVRALSIVGLAVVAVAAIGLVNLSRSGPSLTPAAASINVGTASVTRTTLTNVDDVSGTLGYSGSYTVSAGSPGVLTALPPAGTVVERNGIVAEVNGTSEYLFYGTRPEWRTLDAGVSDGPDVYQLDQNLIALGYGDGMTPSNTFTWYDTVAIENWQSAMGLPVTGVLQQGTVLYLPGPVRIGTHHVEPGAQVAPNAPLTDATDTTRVVSVALDTAKESEVKVGDAVTVQLPSGATTPGAVSAIANSITPPASGGNGGSGSGDGTIAVTVAIADQTSLGSLDGAPVTVDITTASAPNVLAVPITALVVEADGSYAVDVKTKAGSTHRVKVTTGLFTDSDVQVSGTLRAGDTVVVAST
jgi:Putative peptidoglycan binding domain